MVELVDIGVNLTHRSFNVDQEKVIERAMAKGVSTMIVTGTSIRNSQEAQRLASRYPGKLYATAGVHPHDSRNSNNETINILRKLATNKEVVAIGECGLDYNRDFSPRPIQDKCFEAQIELACELALPLFLHERDAHRRFVEILATHKNKIKAAVVHCFTGTDQELKNYLDMDFYIGVTGWICDERRGKHLKDLINKIPLDRLMIETDAPFLTPRNMPNKPSDGRNEPAFLTYILGEIAKSVGKPYDEIAIATTTTAKKFFNL